MELNARVDIKMTVVQPRNIGHDHNMTLQCFSLCKGESNCNISVSLSVNQQ